MSMGRLEGKVAVITAATSGMALATAKLFVEEGAYVFITGRRQENLDEAVKTIGRNVTGVQGDASHLTIWTVCMRWFGTRRERSTCFLQVLDLVNSQRSRRSPNSTSTKLSA